MPQQPDNKQPQATTPAGNPVNPANINEEHSRRAASATPPATREEGRRRSVGAAGAAAGAESSHYPHDIPTQPGMPDPIVPKVVSDGVLYPNDRPVASALTPDEARTSEPRDASRRAGAGAPNDPGMSPRGDARGAVGAGHPLDPTGAAAASAEAEALRAAHLKR